MISSQETSREKDLLPFGWGRFAKAIDRLADVSESEPSGPTTGGVEPGSFAAARPTGSV